jgi:transcriptional regulator with XRE-family HTH domain
MDQDQGVGREIKRLREAKDWSQTKLAAEAGMSVSGISMIENGHRNLSTTTLAKLAEALGVGVRDLFPLDQTPLPDFEARGRGYNSWARPLVRYRSLRAPISNFEELDAEERRLAFDESLELLLELRATYDRVNPDWERVWELSLLHDALYQAVLRMVGVYELEQARGDAGADILDIQAYKERLRQIA